MRSLMTWDGLIDVTVRAGGRVVRRDRFHNMIVDSGLAAMAAGIGGVGLAGGIRWIAVGTGTDTVVASDTKLGAETFRKRTTQQSPTGPQVITTLYLGPGDAVGQIEEIGWFTGAGATADPDTGVLLARVLYSHDKTALESVTITRTDTIARA